MKQKKYGRKVINWHKPRKSSDLRNRYLKEKNKLHEIDEFFGEESWDRRLLRLV